MLDKYKTSNSFWAEAINTACHATNLLYLHKLRHKTAYELLIGKKPNVSYFRVFGCKFFILNNKPKSSKFAPKVDEGIFLIVPQTLMAIMSSTRPPVVLKSHVT
jgi:hypothetical protein